MKFVVKEVAVLRNGAVLAHHIFTCPMPWSLLTKFDKSCASWLIHNHHGLRWEDGNVPYSMVKRLITSAVLELYIFISFCELYYFESNLIIFFYSISLERRAVRILGRRYALTSTAYKYLDIGISVGPVSSVELLLGDNRGNQMVLAHTTWTALIERRADIERLLQSTAPSSMLIRDLRIELVKIRDANVVKLTLHNNSMYMKSSTVFFLFELEHCVENVYFQLCQNVHGVSEKFKQFVIILRRNCITDKCDAARTLRDVFDKNSIIDCELLAYALDNIVYDATHEK
ncbi:uncharacterized protein [Temnothorax nylanderi]|uniref:uncharacterized protein n=1 Tax=Temnothorax nylanderi TaxID=102681 RepID=UPI003A86A331